MNELGQWLDQLASTPWLLGVLIGGAALVLFVRRNVGEKGVKVMGAQPAQASPVPSSASPLTGGASANADDNLDLGDIVNIAQSVIRLDAGQRQSVFAHIKRGNKIEAIKELREFTGMSLTEAKGVVDALAARKR